MRSVLLCGVAAFALACSTSAPAAQPRATGAPAQPESRWRTRIHLVRWQMTPADAPTADLSGLERPFRTLGAPPWIGVGDVPADLRGRRFSAITAVEIAIGPSGGATGCRIVRSSGEPRLDRLVCERIAADSSLRPYHVGPGRPVASRMTVVIGWETLEPGSGESDFGPPVVSPPAPPPPASSRRAEAGPPWPRFDWPGHVRPTALPAIQDMFPANARRRQGTVGIELVQSAELGITGCTVAASSGDPALDEAACAAARRIEFDYLDPCIHCSRASIPLQIVWRRRGGSHVRPPLLPAYERDEAPFPRDPADTRTANYFEPTRPHRLTVTLDDLQGLDLPLGYARFIVLEVQSGRDGRAHRCTATVTSGSLAMDERICRIARDRLRFEPRTDVFGDLTPTGTHSVWVTLIVR